MAMDKKSNIYKQFIKNKRQRQRQWKKRQQTYDQLLNPKYKTETSKKNDQLFVNKILKKAAHPIVIISSSIFLIIMIVPSAIVLFTGSSDHSPETPDHKTTLKAEQPEVKIGRAHV